MSVFNQLMIASGVCWTVTYLLIIRRGVIDLTYGMPAAALLANLSWEAIYSFVYPHSMPQLAVDRVWFMFDVLILLQYLRFGPTAPKIRLAGSFYLQFLLGFAVTFTAILLLGRELKDENGAYAAFGQNLMMSVLFINMLNQRKSAAGQSMYIGIFKMLGTALASFAFYTQTKTYGHSPLLQFLFAAIFVYDVVYIVMLARHLRLQHIKVWGRF
ncbi:hypothetical protein BEL04_12805 [Mucilaginibacter sp. PPCGB 2223]|uniref:transmembrane-type terpene cyclase n=1 Tax=Mucilaginibacter sp. PPCGB 2223 TaxID=1886027 RepID=UPI000826A0B3|nr:hypothetical protein [Mucilaginibacter sp. PPCGB 2223]OCX52344.1 hypothetical protein BEL04_12805 [Mucilaginibacter sp. PPCGB 2223]